MALFITQVYVALEFSLKKRDGFVKFVIGTLSVHKCRTVVGEMVAIMASRRSAYGERDRYECV